MAQSSGVEERSVHMAPARARSGVASYALLPLSRGLNGAQCIHMDNSRPSLLQRGTLPDRRALAARSSCTASQGNNTVRFRVGGLQPLLTKHCSPKPIFSHHSSNRFSLSYEGGSSLMRETLVSMARRSWSGPELSRTGSTYANTPVCTCMYIYRYILMEKRTYVYNNI